MRKIDHRRQMTLFAYASLVLRFFYLPSLSCFPSYLAFFSNYAFNALETEVNMLIHVKRLIFL